MSLWEYKVITSGKGGFATPALLEKFLNDLGREEWEIIHFQTPPDNFLAFTGLVRRSTQRDWTLQDAVAAAAKAEAEKLRAEFEAKFKAAAAGGGGVQEERGPSFLEEKAAPDDGFRKLVDTSRDDDPEAADDEKDDWDKLTAAEEDELPTFFEAIKPHMRRNQRGPGMSVGVDYLAKKWEQTEEDMKGALEECGFVVPTDEDSKVEYLEYDGDLYWLNINRRGELWINTKEKPRPVFRSVKAQRAIVEEAPKPAPAPTPSAGKGESSERQDEAEAGAERKDDAQPGAEAAPQPAPNRQSQSAVALPQGPALLDKVRPHMRRNRRGPGGSGSTSFLARALRSNEADLRTAFAGIGLTLPATAAEKPVYAEFGNELWWLNLDSRGGLWINGREKRSGETAGNATEETAPATSSGETSAVPAGTAGEGSAADTAASAATPAGTETPETPVAAPVTQPSADSASTEALVTGTESVREHAPIPAPTESVASSDTAAIASANTEDSAHVAAPVDAANGETLTGIRALLRETRSGASASKIDRIADELDQPMDDVLDVLVAAGLKVPDKPREKHVFVEQGGEIYWLNKNARGELWLNAKAAKLGEIEPPDDDAGEPAEGAEPGAENGSTGDGEKKPVRRVGVRTRPKKVE